MGNNSGSPLLRDSTRRESERGSQRRHSSRKTRKQSRSSSKVPLRQNDISLGIDDSIKDSTWSMENFAVASEKEYCLLEQRALLDLNPLLLQLQSTRGGIDGVVDLNAIPPWLMELNSWDRTTSIGQVRPYVQGSNIGRLNVSTLSDKASEATTKSEISELHTSSKAPAHSKERTASVSSMLDMDELGDVSAEHPVHLYCCTFEDLRCAAEVVSGVYVAEMERICAVNPTAFLVTEDPSGSPVVFKTRERTEEKVADHYDGELWRVFDMLRVSIVCPDFATLRNVWNEVCESTSWRRIVRVKNRFVEPHGLTQYRDLLCVLEVESEGVVHYCELQIHLQALYVLPSHYHLFRRCPALDDLSNYDVLDLCLLQNVPFLCSLAERLHLRELHGLAHEYLLSCWRDRCKSNSPYLDSQILIGMIETCISRGDLVNAEELLGDLQQDADAIKIWHTLLIKVAAAQASNHNYSKSAEIYRQLLAQDGQNHQAKRGLALLLLETSTSCLVTDNEVKNLVVECMDDDPWLKAKYLELTEGCASALPYYAKAARACSRVLGDTHPLTLDCFFDWGKCQVQSGEDVAGGHQKLWIVYSHRATNLGAVHALTLEAFRELAYALVVTEGETFDGVDGVLKFGMERLGSTTKDDPYTCAWFHTLGMCAKKRGDIDNARSCFQLARDRRASHFGANHRLTLESANELSSLVWPAKKYISREKRVSLWTSFCRQIANHMSKTQGTKSSDNDASMLTAERLYAFQAQLPV